MYEGGEGGRVSCFPHRLGQARAAQKQPPCATTDRFYNGTSESLRLIKIAGYFAVLVRDMGSLGIPVIIETTTIVSLPYPRRRGAGEARTRGAPLNRRQVQPNSPAVS